MEILSVPTIRYHENQLYVSSRLAISRRSALVDRSVNLFELKASPNRADEEDRKLPLIEPLSRGGHQRVARTRPCYIHILILIQTVDQTLN